MRQFIGAAVVGLGAMAVGLLVLAYGCQTMARPMGEGERLYRAKCSSCHQPVDPRTRTADQWRALLEHHGPKLTETERAAILDHLAQP
jgi:cytochrome c5